MDAMLVWRIVALSVLNIVGAFFNAITGFGENITFQLGWYCMSLAGLSNGNLADSCTILSVIAFPVAVVQVAWTWKHINVGLAVVFATSSSAAAALGVAILMRYDNVWLKRTLGAVLVAVFLWRAFMEQRYRSPPSQKAFPAFAWPHFLAAAATGGASGLLGGLFSVPGPPAMIFVLLSGLGKDEWRGTSAVSAMISIPVRILAIIGSSHSPSELLERLWPEIAVSVLASLVGNCLGNVLAFKVTERVFREAILVFLLYGGATLLTAGMGNVTLWVLAIVVSASVMLFNRRRAVAEEPAVGQLNRPLISAKRDQRPMM